MALLVVNGISLNTSTHEFHEGTARPYQIESAISKSNVYEQTGNISLIPEFMQLVENGDALFPMSFAVNFCRTNASAMAKFREYYPIFKSDEKRVLDFLKHDITEATRSYIKRLLLMLRTTTTVSGLDDLAGDVWSEWISSMKEENTQFKADLGFNSQDRRALSCLAKFMDAHYPSESGHLNILKVRRSSTGGFGKSRYFLENPPQEFTKWIEIFENYKSIKSLRSAKMANGAFRLFASWLESYPKELYSEPQAFLSAYRLSPTYVDFIKSISGKSWNAHTRNEASFIIRMVDHFIEENMVFIEDGERTDLGHPIVTVREREQIIGDFGTSSGGRSQASSHPMPLRWVQEVQKILTEDDWAWPRSLDSHWFDVPVDGKAMRVWNPVIAYLVYGMTELPWRKIQFKSLDSGEGDSEAYDFRNDVWVRNRSPAAGYWDGEARVRRKARGVLNRQGDNFAFYVNTNKTKDRKNHHNEMSGYYVPWKYDPMIALFSDLREWQEKYNLLTKPSRYKDVSSAFDGADKPSKKVEESIPDRFYLFRDVQGFRNKFSPPSENKIYGFWRLLMDELERRLKSKGEDATIILSRNKSGGPSVAQFHMHGLRVSGLTAFAEAGVPIEILSKLVAGHASILMTIYYLKYSAAHVTDVLSEARQKVEAIAAKDFGRTLRNMSIDDAMKVAVANEEYTLRGVAEGEISVDQFFDTGLGVCPYNGTRCSDGVALSGGRTAPVPGGAKNCLQCRHFITGEPWLMPLALNQQRLAGKAADLSKKIDYLRVSLEQSEGERAKIVREDGPGSVPPVLSRKIIQTEQEIERHSMDLDDLLGSMNRAHVIIETVKAIQKKSRSDKLPALVGDANADSGEFREGTRFELIDTVLQASRVYPILHDDHFESERRSYIDAIMYNSGLAPLSVMNLTDEQKITAADAAAKWLMTKVGAQETQLLISGAQNLSELGFSSEALLKKVELSVSTSPLLEAAE